MISERVVMAVILLNTAAMTAAGFYAKGTSARFTLDAIDYVCVLFFVVEAILKIRRWGWHEYRLSMWNRFDLIITLLCLPVLVEPFAHEAHYPTWLPVFRAGRLFRLFRLLRFIPDANGLARGIGRSLKASVGVFLALALVNLIFALAANMIFGEVVPEHFGDPLRSLYSIFQIFTLEGWYEYPTMIAERAGESWALGARVFFIAAVLIGGVLGLSLANAVFIDEMTLDNTKVLEDKVTDLTEEVRQLRLLLQATVVEDGSAPHRPDVDTSQDGR
ncbi:MAG: ion transporter [Acidobacteriota bacterium]